jgi:hypothetical protein
MDITHALKWMWNGPVLELNGTFLYFVFLFQINVQMALDLRSARGDVKGHVIIHILGEKFVEIDVPQNVSVRKDMSYWTKNVYSKKNVRYDDVGTF